MSAPQIETEPLQGQLAPSTLSPDALKAGPATSLHLLIQVRVSFKYQVFALNQTDLT